MCDYLSAICWCHSVEHVLYGINAHGKHCLFVNLILEQSNFKIAAIVTLFVMELITGIGQFFFFTDDCM